VRVLIDYRPALRERSGSGEYTHQLAKALLNSTAGTRRPRVIDVTLFSSSWKDRLTPAPDLAGAALVDCHVPVRLLNLAWHRLEWPPAETLAGAAFDVVHSPHPLLTPARNAAQVVTIHDLNFLSHPERTRAEIRRDYPSLAGAHARRADAILVPSAYTAGEVERLLGIPRERMAICAPGAPGWKPRSTVPCDGYILFFSTLEPRKNLGALLDAYESLIAPAGSGDLNRTRPQIPPLVLAGKATADARPWLDRIGRPPLLGVVRHVGYVNANDRRALYEGARMLVQPSLDEGFGMTVLEAMTVGVPVIAASRGSLPEVIGGAGLLVDPEPAGIAHAIRRLLDEEGLAAACAAQGIARARAFNWDETADRVYDTYKAAVERRRARGSRRT
jgi:glycosyltransferase involved in cell wall biosynthesis